jgi:hypothetical protein
MSKTDNAQRPAPVGVQRVVVLREVVSETWRTANPRNCPVVLRDGDGKSVGACWHYLRSGACPSHGQIYEHNASGQTPACSAFVRVATIMPFFRYAVGPTSQHSPAIPYFTRKGAEAFFEDVVRELPWCGAVMYRRTLRGMVTVREYRPNTEAPASATKGLIA